MNERIREFEKQCWSHYIDGALIDGHLHFDTQKFNKLIIQDCIQTLINNGYDDAAKCLQDIHFGIDYPV
jgi:hypothetical protein